MSSHYNQYHCIGGYRWIIDDNFGPFTGFRCRNGGCQTVPRHSHLWNPQCVYNSPNIPLKWMCNTEEDCSDGSDEIDCGNLEGSICLLKI